MDTKIILGSVFFFGILVLAGWVLINEEGRMAEFTVQYEARSMERGATLFEANCTTCHGPQGLGSGRAPALNNPSLFNGDRLDEMSWTGTLFDYIENAVAAGRPNSGAYWPEAMPTWSEVYGGPLRTDQVTDITRYVMNWETSALDEENPPQVLQDFILPADPAVMAAGAEDAIEPLSSGEPVGINANFADLPAGDAARGESLYTTLACASCHEQGVIAPPTVGSATRAADRIASVPELEGYTVEQYLVESIVMPNAYLVPDDGPSPYAAGGISIMQQDYSERIDAQDLADLIAYLLTQM